MDNATFEITVISVVDLNNGRRFGRRMRTYASLWTDPGALKSTRIDTDGGSNPVWNEKLQVPLTRSFIHRRGSSIAIEIYCKTMLGNKRVGCAEIPFSDIVDGYGTALNSSHFLSYRLKTPKGKPRGTIDLSVRLLQYSPSLPSPRPPKLGNSQPDFVSNPCNPQTPTLQNANYTDGRHRYDQNGAAFGGSSCAIGVPISVGQPFHWPYRPWQSQLQGSHGNVNYYSPVPTSIYPPCPYSQQASYARYRNVLSVFNSCRHLVCC